jgi:hypothetical protein
MTPSSWYRLSVAAVILALIVYINPTMIIVDHLIPIVPGEVVQGFGVYASKLLCGVNSVRRALPPWLGRIDECEMSKNPNIHRVIIAVNKGGSVFGAKLAYEIALVCGLCPGMSHNKQSLWPPQSDELQDFVSDIQLAIPTAEKWEVVAFKDPSKRVKCVVITRDPFKVG